jgi:sugar transferase (PEP-CTERM/EpsH1 system associated)
MHATTDVSPELTGPAGGDRRAPLIVHVIFRLDVGGLENGLANLINRIPASRYRHAVVSLTDFSAFRERIRRDDVPVYALHKPAGNSPATLLRLWRLFRRLRPDIVHSRNLGALDAAMAAAFSGVPVRIHGEHGRDIDDLDGTNARRRLVRRLYQPFVHRYIALSKDLEAYLQDRIGVPPSRIAQIYNGVDTEQFHPAAQRRDPLPEAGFAGAEHFVIGSVGRMQDVKDPLMLARAFASLVRTMPGAAQRLRLAMVGDGPLREAVQRTLAEAGVAQYAWLPGERRDIARLMRTFDLFVLPSLAEGISNTILEAMATGLPVAATAVGGNPELIQSGSTGTLVPRGDVEGMARAMRAYAEDAELCRRHGGEARRTAERRFGMDAMTSAYLSVYDRALEATRRRAAA